MADQVLQYASQAVFVLAFVVTVVDFARRPGKRRLEIAVLFGTLAVIIGVQGFTRLTGLTLPREASFAVLLLFLAQPYLLLRLLGHFRPVPREQHVLAIALLLGSWVAVVLGGQPLPQWIGLFLVGAFVYVEGYAAVQIVRGARDARGVARRRMMAVAIGAGLLAGVLLISAVQAALPDLREAITLASRLMALGCAIALYVGFATPRWLVRQWQLADLHSFRAARPFYWHVSGATAVERRRAALDYVGAAATNVIGGKAAIVALRDSPEKPLTLHRDPENREKLEANQLSALHVMPGSPLARAWTARGTVVVDRSSRWDPELIRLAKAFGGAGCALIAPLVTSRQTYGVVVVLLDRGSLFVDEEVAMLEVLANQSVLAIEVADLYVESERQLEERAELAERLREQNVALEEATRLKSEFLANMSHELRTTLNAIIGFSELLIDTPADEDDRATRLTYTETIHRNGKHLLGLINDILDLSKIEAGKMDLHREEFDLRDLVEGTLSTIESLADKKSIRLTADAKVVGSIYADSGRVKQILLNLLSNAVKFTPEGGRVSVEAVRTDDGVQITIADTGIGIAPEHHDRVFGEFQQVDAAASRKHEGTGLGLALTKRFVEMHGGRIWLESAVGAGSRFHFTLPHAIGAEGATESAPIAVSSNGHRAVDDNRPLVLIVDDDPQATNLMALYLGRGGYRTEYARDGEEALQMARSHRPAAITLDIMIPKVDGWDVLRALKADPATRDIPVVIASILDNQSLGYALGAVDYFVKPIDRRALLERLERSVTASRRPMRLLAIDDDPEALLLLASMLPVDGYSLRTASGGAHGIEMALADPPDAILLDLMMPEVSGFDVVETLRANAETREIPILVITAKELTEADKAALIGRVSTVLRKGTVSAVELLPWLDKVTGRVPRTNDAEVAGVS